MNKKVFFRYLHLPIVWSIGHHENFTLAFLQNSNPNFNLSRQFECKSMEAYCHRMLLGSLQESNTLDIFTLGKCSALFPQCFLALKYPMITSHGIWKIKKIKNWN